MRSVFKKGKIEPKFTHSTTVFNEKKYVSVIYLIEYVLIKSVFETAETPYCLDLQKNMTEKSFSPIGCAINDHGLYGLFCSKSETRQQDDNSCGGKTWGYEAASLRRSLIIS